MKRIFRRIALILTVFMLLGAVVPAMAAVGTVDPARCDHEWDKGKIVRHQSCTSKGTKQYTCKRCGATKTASYGSALGHNWGAWSEWKIEGDVATRSHTCKRCRITKTQKKPAEELIEGGMGGGNEELLVLTCTQVNGIIKEGGTDYADFAVRVDNNSDAAVRLTADYISLDPNDSDKNVSSGTILQIPTLEIQPHDMQTGRLVVQVSEHDRSFPELIRKVTLHGITQDPSGYQLSTNEVKFTCPLEKDPASGIPFTPVVPVPITAEVGEPVSIPTSPVIPPIKTITGEIEAVYTSGTFTIEKSVIGQPKNKSFYVLGEPIRFKLTVKNDCTNAFKSLEVSDSLVPGYGVIWTFTSLAPHASREYEYVYVPTEKDMAYPTLSNQATVTALHADTGAKFHAVSETVTVDLGETIRRVNPSSDLCAVSLLAGEEETLACTVSHCTEHAAVAKKAEALLAAGGTDAQAILTAYAEVDALWNESIDALYDQILKVAETKTAKAVIQNEKAAFYGMLEAYDALMQEKWPDQPEKAAEFKAELLREKCAELCWLTRSRSGALPDAMLSQKVPQSGTDGCLAEIRSQRDDLLVYALNFCSEHTEAAQALYAALTDVLKGSTDAAALKQARLLWEELIKETEEKLPGTSGAAAQNAYSVFTAAYIPFIRLFCPSPLCSEEAFVKHALIGTLRLCPFAEMAENQGGTAPIFTDLF